jgi:hypothetical protein
MPEQSEFAIRLNELEILPDKLKKDSYVEIRMIILQGIVNSENIRAAAEPKSDGSTNTKS